MSGFTLSALQPSFFLPKLVSLKKLIFSKLSSAHVYLRQPDEQPHGDWEHLPAALVNDAAQLVKANSIEGESQLQAKREEFLALERVTGHRFTISHAVPSSQSEGRMF